MSAPDPRGLWGHHPDCPMSRHGDSVLVRTAMHPCNFCDVADKAEQRALAQAHAEIALAYQNGHANGVRQGQRDALVLLAEACEVIDGLADQQAMGDDWYEAPLAKFRAAIKGDSDE